MAPIIRFKSLFVKQFRASLLRPAGPYRPCANRPAWGARTWFAARGPVGCGVCSDASLQEGRRGCPLRPLILALPLRGTAPGRRWAADAVYEDTLASPQHTSESVRPPSAPRAVSRSARRYWSIGRAIGRCRKARSRRRLGARRWGRTLSEPPDSGTGSRRGLAKRVSASDQGDGRVPAKLARAQYPAPPERAYSRSRTPPAPRHNDPRE